jgi:hypothetical protein
MLVQPLPIFRSEESFSTHVLRWFGFPAFAADQAMMRPLSNDTITYQKRIYCQYNSSAYAAFVAERIGSDKLFGLRTFSYQG